MVLQKDGINLLPAKWKLPSSLRRFERTLKVSTFAVLGVYIFFLAVLFGFFGFLKIRHDNILSSSQSAAREMASLRQIEASEEIISDKVSFAKEAITSQVNTALATQKTLEFIPSSGIELQDLSSDSRGRIGITAVTTSVDTLIDFFDVFEKQAGLGHGKIQTGIGSFDLGSNEKIQFKIDLVFIPSFLKVLSDQ